MRSLGRVRTAAALALGLVATLVVAGPADSSVRVTETFTLPATGSVTLAGRGFGHGIGMSQWGARAAAAAGVSHQEILSAYYPGTSLQTGSNTEIRVQLKADADDDLRVVAVPGMVMSDASGSVRQPSFPGVTTTQWRVARNANGNGFVLFGLVEGSWRLWSTAPSPGFISLSTQPASTVRVVLPDGSQREYRGSVRSVPDGPAPGSASVNAVRMEDYLRSVVPSESPSSWPAAALRSQAVAARTYAAHDRASRPSSAWHTCDDTACQVYKGVSTRASSGTTVRHEAASTDAAISATANQLLVYGGSPAFTQFSASNGGWTAAGSRPYLTAHRDPWDAVDNPAHAWTARVTTDQLRAKFPGVGTPRTLTVVSRTGDGEWGGRVESVVVAGSAGSSTVTGASFRTMFGLRSTWWKPTGTSRLETDVTVDGRPDLLARTPAGALRSYEGNRSGGFSTAARQIGSGWDSMLHVSRAADFTSDGVADVLAVDPAGNLWRYPSAGQGFAPRQRMGTGWHTMRSVISPGDMTADGRADVLAVDSSGVLWLYPGDGAGGLAPRRAVGTGWGSLLVLGAGDMDGDGIADVVARSADGRLLLYRGSVSGNLQEARVIGTGWQSMRLLTVHGDWSGDGRPDVLASDASGALYLYPWTGSGFQDRRVVGSGWQVFDLLL